MTIRRLIRRGDIESGSITLEIAIPLLTDALDTTSSTPAESNERYSVSSALISSASAVYFEFAYDATALTSDGSIDLYDVDAASPITTLTLTAGSSSERTRSTDILSGLQSASGHEIKVRLTSDGTNRAVVYMARLILVIDIGSGS